MYNTDETCVNPIATTVHVDSDSSCTSHMCDYCCPISANSMYIFAAIVLLGFAIVIYLQRKILKCHRKK